MSLLKEFNDNFVKVIVSYFSVSVNIYFELGSTQHYPYGKNKHGIGWIFIGLVQVVQFSGGPFDVWNLQESNGTMVEKTLAMLWTLLLLELSLNGFCC